MFKNITINYTHIGTAFSDFNLEDDFNKAVINGHGYFNTSTENIIHYARLLLIKKTIEKLTVVYDGKSIKVNNDGMLEYCPEGLLDRCVNLHRDILKERLK